MRSMLQKRYLFAALMLSFPSALMAQDTTYTTTTITESEQLWYLQPWVWIAGGVILLLLLIALFSGGKKNKNTSRTDKVIMTKTVRTESDVD